LLILNCAGLGFPSTVAQAKGAKTPSAPPFQTRELKLEGRYLNLPVREGAPRRTLTLSVDGRAVQCFEIQLADKEPDFWAFLDVSAWRGKPAVVRLDRDPVLVNPWVPVAAPIVPLPRDALAGLRVGDEIENAAQLYRERLRPQFHFTTRRGYLNDPHALGYYQGEYHLFYQTLPFSVSGYGDKCWGHAVSRDLLHWEELPVALYADEEGAKWSGSGMVDWHNVAGLQQGTEPALLVFYTATSRSAMQPKSPEAGYSNFTQNLAYSNDRGRTWSEIRRQSGAKKRLRQKPRSAGFLACPQPALDHGDLRGLSPLRSR